MIRLVIPAVPSAVFVGVRIGTAPAVYLGNFSPGDADGVCNDWDDQ
jgi:hypothetical protein